MALSYIAQAQDTPNKNFIKIIDATGDYDASTNPGGWSTGSGPNPQRSDITVSTLTYTLPNETVGVVVDLFPTPYEFPETNGTMSFTPAISSTSTPLAIVTNVSNTSPIVVTLTGHGLSTDDMVAVTGVTGNLAANGYWQIEVLTANTFSLLGSNGSGSYNGGGYVIEGSGDLASGVYKFVFDVTAALEDYQYTLYHLHTTAVETCITQYGYRISGCSCSGKARKLYEKMKTDLDRAQDAFESYQYETAQDIIDSLTSMCTRINNANCGC